MALIFPPEKGRIFFPHVSCEKVSFFNKQKESKKNPCDPLKIFQGGGGKLQVKLKYDGKKIHTVQQDLMNKPVCTQCSEHYYFQFASGSPVARRLGTCKASPELPAPGLPMKPPPLPTSTRDGAPHAASLHAHALLGIPTDISTHQHRCGMLAAGEVPANGEAL